MKTRKKKSSQLKTRTNPKKERRISRKSGLPPGSLVHIGQKMADTVTVHLNRYNTAEIYQTEIIRPDDLELTGGFSNWIEICGLHDTGVIDSIGNKLNISQLILEDILNTEQRPKFDQLNGSIFLTLKTFANNDSGELYSDQVSFVVAKNFLVSFQENESALFDPVKTLLAGNSSKIRQRGLDYLLYSLIDIIIDQYYLVIEGIGDRLEELEDLIFENPSNEMIEKSRTIKKEIISIRKALIPTLEAINRIKRDEPDLILKETGPFYDDIHDHIVQILDSLDAYRELSAELKESYLSNLNLRMNQVMKVLTIVTAVFIPLSFISGIYGMNFRHMPELDWQYGYFAVLGVMLVITILMFIYFRRKKWL